MQQSGTIKWCRKGDRVSDSVRELLTNQSLAPGVSPWNLGLLVSYGAGPEISILPSPFPYPPYTRDPSTHTQKLAVPTVCPPPPAT